MYTVFFSRMKFLSSSHSKKFQYGGMKLVARNYRFKKNTPKENTANNLVRLNIKSDRQSEKNRFYSSFTQGNGEKRFYSSFTQYSGEQIFLFGLIGFQVLVFVIILVNPFFVSFLVV